MTTNHSTVVGDGVSLATAVKDFRVIADSVQLESFTGRDWLAAEVSERLMRASHGYVWLDGEAGVGKTAFAARLVEQHSYVHHFVRSTNGDLTRVAIANLVGQLVRRYGLDDFTHPGGDVLRPDALTPEGFEAVLAAAAHHRGSEPVVLVVDGLDEAEPHPRGLLPWGLPSMLPAGVHVIALHRRGFTPHPTDAPGHRITLDRDDARNHADLRNYLERRLTDHVLAAKLVETGIEPSDAVDALLRACCGVWVYVRYVLTELCLGERSFDQVDLLPRDLVGYYDSQIRRWEYEPEWNTFGEFLLTALAAAREPVTLDTLTRWTHIPVRNARRWCDRILRPFLDVIGPPRARTYTLYHASAREFAHGTLPDLDNHPGGPDAAERALDLAEHTRETHHRIARHYLDLFGGTAAQLSELAAEPSLAETDHGYPLRHLAAHLVAASRPEDLHALLACTVTRPTGRCINIWFTAHDHTGTVGYYLDALAQARDHAQHTTDHNLRTTGHTTIEAELRYTLTLATIRERTENVPTPLIRALLRHRIWTPAKAFDHAQTTTDPLLRLDAFVAVAAHLSEPQRVTVLTEAFEAALTLTHEFDRAQVLVGIAPYLSESQLIRALDAALALVDGSHRARVLVAVAAHLSEPQRDTVLAQASEAALTLTDEDDRAQVLVEIAPHLPESQLARVLDAALAFRENHRARVLVGIAPRLPEWQRATVLAQALKAALALTELDEDKVLAGVAPHLPESQLVRVLDAALALTYEEDRAVALAGIAPHLPESQVVRVLDATLALNDERARAGVLVDIASHLPEPQRATTLARALDSALAMTDEYDRAWLLAGIGSRLHGQQGATVLAQAFDAALALTDEDHRAQLLVNIVPDLPESQVARVLHAALALTDEGLRAQVLTDIAPCLSELQLGQVLNAALALSDTDHQARVLGDIAPHLSEPQLVRALSAALTLTDDNDRAWALTGIGPHLSEPQRAAVLTQAHDAAIALTNEGYRSRALLDIGLHLPEPQRATALTQALDTILEFTIEFHRAWALGNIAPHLPEPQLTRALDAALALTNVSFWGHALVGIAPHLPDSQLVRVLDGALAFIDEDDRARALVDIAPYIPESDLRRLISQGGVIAARLLDTSRGPQLLTCLSQDVVLHVFRSCVEQGTRAETLRRLVACVPALCASGVNVDIGDVCQALDGVVEIWP